MRTRSHGHSGLWASVAHRLSGVLLALFLPLHFLVLGLALDGAEGLDRFLAFSDLALVKLAEWGLVVLLTLHLSLGLRLLALELLPWRSQRNGWIAGGAGAALAAGLLFLLRIA